MRLGGKFELPNMGPDLYESGNDEARSLFQEVYTYRVRKGKEENNGLPCYPPSQGSDVKGTGDKDSSS